MENQNEKGIHSKTGSVKTVTQEMEKSQIFKKTLQAASTKTREELLAELDGYRLESERGASQEQAVHREDVERNQWQAKLNQAAVPMRFRNKLMDNLVPRDDDHETMIKWAGLYVENFDDMLALGRNIAMVGGPGTGKTYLACGILNALLRKRYRAAFTTVSNYFTNLHASYGESGGEKKYIEHMTGLDLLVIDEVGAYQRKDMDSMRSSLFHLLNSRYENCRPTILISNLESEDMIDYVGERYERRLMENGGRVFSFPWASYRGVDH